MPTDDRDLARRRRPSSSRAAPGPRARDRSHPEARLVASLQQHLGNAGARALLLGQLTDPTSLFLLALLDRARSGDDVLALLPWGGSLSHSRAQCGVGAAGGSRRPVWTPPSPARSAAVGDAEVDRVPGRGTTIAAPGPKTDRGSRRASKAPVVAGPATSGGRDRSRGADAPAASVEETPEPTRRESRGDPAPAQPSDAGPTERDAGRGSDREDAVDAATPRDPGRTG